MERAAGLAVALFLVASAHEAKADNLALAKEITRVFEKNDRKAIARLLVGATVTMRRGRGQVLASEQAALRYLSKVDLFESVGGETCMADCCTWLKNLDGSYESIATPLEACFADGKLLSMVLAYHGELPRGWQPHVPARFVEWPPANPNCPVELTLVMSDRDLARVSNERADRDGRWRSRHLSLWVGSLLATDVYVVDCRRRSTLRFGPWGPMENRDPSCHDDTPPHVVACLPRVPELGARVMVNAPIPTPTGQRFVSLERDEEVPFIPRVPLLKRFVALVLLAAIVLVYPEARMLLDVVFQVP